MSQKRILIVGGGLAGLITSLHLQRAGLSCTVVEKRAYPFHRVCGEYISNEVLPYLDWLNAFPSALEPSSIRRFQLTSTNGASAELPLDLGGFGVSRFALDHFLYRLAQQRGVRFMLEKEVTELRFRQDQFIAEISGDAFEADVVVGAFGKRSRLDKTLNRDFIHRHSPYVGVKYHLRLPGIPQDLISLHNFRNGYCGTSHVEGGVVNLCYLTHRDNVRTYGSLRAMEEAVLFKNPFLRDAFNRGTFLFEKPETINEISFETKAPVENHVLMCGDAAGMITPLCGNGMAIAMHSAKLICDHIIRFCESPSYTRMHLESDYASAWKGQFATRLWAGRNIQRLFGSDRASQLAVTLARHWKPVANRLMKMTHGKPF